MSVSIKALVNDPTELLSLLYSKYGDIEEDMNYLYINQIIFNKISHYTILFKEHQYTSMFSEFLKRSYRLDESLERLPQLSEYYRTYHMFFCRPFFRKWSSTKLLHKYGDKQAELFYKNNLANSSSQIKKLTSRINNSHSDSLSSLDNQTQVVTIFNKRVRKIIECENKENITLTLNTETHNNNNGLITHRTRNNNSFIDFINEFINAKPNHQPTHNVKGIYNMKVASSRPNTKNMKMKRSLCALTKIKNEYIVDDNNCNSNINNNKILLSPKLSPYIPNFKSNIIEFNQNKPKQNSIHVIKNKTSFHNNSNCNSQQKLSKLSYSNNTNTNTNKNSIMIMTIPTNNNGGNTTTNLNINLNFNLNNNSNNCSNSNNNNNNNHIVQFNPHQLYKSKRSLSKKNRISLNKTKPSKNSKHKSTITDVPSFSSNHNTHLLHPSSSIPRYSSSMKSKSKTSKIKLIKQASYPHTVNNSNNNIVNVDHLSHSNVLMSLQFHTNKRLNVVSSQRSLSGNNNNNNNQNANNNSGKTQTISNRKKTFSPNNSINLNYHHYTNSHSLNKAPPPSVKECIFISRNKKNLQKISVQTILSSKGKNKHKSNEHNNNNKEHKNKAKTIITKSVDEKTKNKTKKTKSILSELTNFNWCNNYNNNIHRSNQPKHKMINQLDNLIKCAKYSNTKKTNNNINYNINNNNNNNKHTTTYHHKINKHKYTKSNGKNSYILEASYGTSRGNSTKQTQSHANTNFRLKNSERKTMRVFSPKL